MQPEELYELDTEETQGLEGADLLVYLEGFMDAGAAGRLVTEHLLDAFEHKTVARFDTDRLLDYRSRRPLMMFDGGKWESYDAPELAVHRLTDAAGKSFLLLTGPEPALEHLGQQRLYQQLPAQAMIAFERRRRSGMRCRHGRRSRSDPARQHGGVMECRTACEPGRRNQVTLFQGTPWDCNPPQRAVSSNRCRLTAWRRQSEMRVSEFMMVHCKRRCALTPPFARASIN